VPRAAADGTLLPLNRAEIVNQWSLWWGVAMMAVGSVTGLLARPGQLVAAFRSGLRRRSGDAGPGVLRHIELPIAVSAAGVPVLALLGAWMAHAFFGASWTLALAGLPLILVLALIATHSMALTAWTPTGAMAKISQFTIGAIDRTNPATNLSVGGMTAEVASNASNLLSDIKPGYMLGAKPRQQAVGHVIGIVSGALASTPLFYVLFLPRGAGEARAVSTIVSDRFPFPGAMQWKGVSDLIAGGLRSVPTSAAIAMGVAAVLAVVFEVARVATRGRFPLSAVSIGLGVVLPPDACLGMFAGALLFHTMSRRHAGRPGTRGHAIWVDSVEPICAGLITGAALVGVGDAIVNVLLA
jgi:uncharacterized oligopeptide transporter (OPT) family protein